MLKQLLFVILITIINNMNLSYAQLLFNDDFSYKNEYWYWRSDGNQSVPTVKNGLLHLKLENAVDSFYCNTEIYDPTEPYGPGTQVRTRLKTSPIHTGSRGWGFWDGDFTIYDVLFEFDVAWVMQQGSPIQNQDFNWFYFGVATDTAKNRLNYNLQNILDETQWHTYKIIWDFDKVSFHVDDILLYETFEELPDQNMRMDIWIDNRTLNLSNPIEFSNNNAAFSEMYVDFVEVSGLNGPSIQRETSGNIILWDSPNTFPNGKINYLWKEYKFSTQSKGEVLLFLTGSAENYGDVSEPDKLKIKLNDTDYQWDTNYALDGSKLKGNGKSIVLSTELNAGEHSLEIHSNITPYLRDVIIVHSDNGKTLFNREYNEIAEGEDGLWKTIEFDSHQSEEITILISGTGDKNSSLRFELNTNDFGWQGNFAIDGNELNGLPNTVVLKDNLISGKNYLKIYKQGKPQLFSVAAYGNSVITNINNGKTKNNSVGLKINPNPFNATTKISYITETSAYNKVRIFSVLGEEIAALVNEFQSSGNYSIDFNAATLTSGIYFCVLESGNNFIVEKLLLMK